MKYSRKVNFKKAQEFNIKGKFPSPPTACIHGHFLAAKYKNIPDGRFCTWLRDPAERVVSRYHHGLKAKERSADSPLSLEQFQNIYARYLQNMPLTEFDFVGITEDYDDSLKLFSEIFSIKQFGAGVIKNKNPLKKTNFYDISKPLRKEIVRLNSQDVELYQQALEINAALKRQIGA
jgi:hypothetical protein